MIEEYSTRVTRTQQRKWKRERRKKEGENKKEKGKSNGRQGPPSCRQAGHPFSASRPSLSLWHLISVFPIFLFRSVSPGPPARLVLVFTPSSPFLFVFRGDRGPETDVRAVKNGRRCASGTGTFSSLPSLPLYPSSQFPALNSTTDALVPGVSSDRPPRRVLPFCSLPPSCPTLAIDPRPNCDHLTQRTTCVPDIAQTKRFIIVP